MSDHVFRHEDKVPLLGYRQFMREALPNGSAGCVIEDVDVMLRQFSPSLTGDDGRFRLFEVKASLWTLMHRGQHKTLARLDRLLRRADPAGDEYCGFYFVQSDVADWRAANVWAVNGWDMEHSSEFVRWLDGATTIDPYRFTGEFECPLREDHEGPCRR